MEHTYSYNQKKCATCEYWGGSREVNRAGSAVTYDTDDLCGPCYGDSGRASRNHERADAHCGHFVKWSAFPRHCPLCGPVCPFPGLGGIRTPAVPPGDLWGLCAGRS